MAYIRKLRLKRCLKELRDPYFARKSVAELGLKWGFNDVGTFRRNFKKVFQMTPKEARKSDEVMAISSSKQRGEVNIDDLDRSYENWVRSLAE